MRLKKITIGEYKNLKNFTLNFDGTSFIDVFVGKNGSGKSNLFEALIEIFRHLHENDHSVKFDYILEYSIENSDVYIQWKWVEEVFVDRHGQEVTKITKDKLPDNILIYYSGHNTKVSELVEEYEDKFKRGLRIANPGDTREFIGIGNEYKSLLLSVLLIQPEQNKARQFIVEKLGIRDVSSELKITLQRPEFAKGKKTYDIDQFVEETRFWGAQGITKVFLDKLITVRKGRNVGRKVRDEGFLPTEDKYILYYDIADFQRIFADETTQSIFRNFDNLKTIEMLEDISVGITLNDGTEINVQQFSDGQFQSIYIYSIIELFKDRNCVTLLDEPDSFLHPEWQYDFLKQIFEITDVPAVNNHVLMTSHSAMTLIPHNQRKINLFNFIDGNLRCCSVNKSYAINQLSSSLLKFSENEQILSIINRINAEDKPILFTEGSTDPAILNHAWNQLYQESIPFNIIYAFNCTFLRQIIQDNRIINELNGNTMFGLFDFDQAYNEWNSINSDRDIETDPYNGLAKKVKDKNSFALLLPVPRIADIEKQVFKPGSTETFKGQSELEIEHLFYGDIRTHEFFENEPVRGGGTVLKFKDSRKTEFSKEIIPLLDRVHFEVFRPMFDLIKSRIPITV